MAIDIELSGLKAAGTYRFERDLSTLSSNVANESYSNLRLIVGFSKKGPFNSVQLITSSSQFIKMYGNIDRSLEKRGSYFHRSALVALSAGPILCLNLLPLDPDNDLIMHRSISTNIKKSNKNICNIPYKCVYNTDKFWYLSSESYLDGVHIYDNAVTQNEDTNNVLNFTNVGDKPISILVKKASEKNTKGYELTLNNWFGAENVPEYLNGTSFVSDYMVEVYVISGDFGPKLYETNPKTIDDVIYNTYSQYDTEEDNPYKRFASDITYQEYFDKYGFKSEKLNKFLGLPSVNVIATYVGSLLPNFTNKLNQNIWIEDMINNDTMTTGLLCSVDIDMIESAEIDVNSGFVDEKIDVIGHNFYLYDAYNTIKDLNYLSYAISEDRYLKFDGTDSDSDLENDALSFICDISAHGKFTEKYFITENGVPLDLDADNEVLINIKDFQNKKIKVGDFILSYIKENTNIDITSSIDISSLFSRLTRVIEIKPIFKESDEVGEENKYIIKDKEHVRVVCSDKILLNYSEEDKEQKYPFICKYTTIDNICDRFHWTYLKGFRVREESMPGGETDQEKNNRQNKILNMISELNDSSNLYKALIDRDCVQWRYLVDTFGLGIESECKKVYSLLCKGRQSALALVNMPSMKDFKRSIDPSFVDKYGGVKSEYIANGGDLSKAPANLFSLPKEENGASWAAYFYPYLKISDLAAIKTVPPAAYVSNLYVSKYNNFKPWSIVAGPKRGVISGNQIIGVEGVLTHDDRMYLEPVGINSIVWENGVGVEIFANKTAKQTPVSALSSIHAREACIYIQDTVEAILKNYNWEQNTARNREEIKTLVDTFLANMKQGDGIYAFKTVMDTTNNTTEVIDRNMGVIDIYVEVVRGLEILAQRLTVLKTGSIESGNFE